MKHTKHIYPACNATLSLGEDGKLRRRVVLQAEFKFDPFDEAHYRRAKAAYDQALSEIKRKLKRKTPTPPDECKSPVDEHITAQQHANAARAERAAGLAAGQRAVPPSALAYEPCERITADEQLDAIDCELSRSEERHGLLPVLIVMALGAAATAYIGWVLWTLAH